MMLLLQAVRRARARRAAGAEAGMTLAEVLVAVTLLGLVVAGITGALGTASRSSAAHQQQVTLDTVLRGYAESIKEYVRLSDGYQERTGDQIPDYSPATVGYSVPAGFTIDPTSNQYQCSSPLNVVLVLDLSSSIADAGAVNQVKSAANAFLGGLSATTARVAVVGFGSQQSGGSAPNAADIYRSPTVVRSNLPALQNTVNGLPFGPAFNIFNWFSLEYTNWDAGLVKAKEILTSAPASGGFPLGQPPLVVVVTDGVPNRWLNDTTGAEEGSSTEFDSVALEHAVTQADLIKNYADVFAVGVATLSNQDKAALQAISGTVEYPTEPDFTKADWTAVTDFGTGPNGLQTRLAAIADDLSEETFSTTCDKPDQGVQLLTLTARSTSGLATQTLQVVVRRP